MSNSSVGTVYSQIIDNVLDSARVDLEENGVDESILDELRKGWQKKLSQQQLAVFPWDPKPDPPAQTAPAPPAALVDAQVANGGGYAQSQMPTSGPGLSFPQPAVKAEPTVKVEPGLDAHPGMNQPSTNNVQARVMQNLQAQYGARASASIGKLQDSMGQAPAQGQQRPQGDLSLPPFGAPSQQNPQQRPPGGVPPVNQMPRAPAVPGGQRPAPSQMDGADEDDFDGMLVHQSAGGQTTELGRVEIDRLLHAQIAARAKSMEGGGLMLPLKRAPKRGKTSAREGLASNAVEGGHGRFDGGDDDIKSEDDDEAINSDLDDPEDNLDDEDDDDDGGYIMLCMYDKVQRVKNKWKCVLKDGVLSVNGKDYVFHKATGEYEW